MNQIYYNNSLLAWTMAAGIILVSFAVIKLFSFFIISRVKKWALKTSTTWDNFLVSQIEKSAIPILYVSAVFFALNTLIWPAKIGKAVHMSYLIVITYFLLRIISSAFKKFVFSYIRKQEQSEAKEKQAGGLIIIVNVVIWIVGVVFLIDNLGYNVTTLIAGLGIGGIAIALAAQAILGDLFSYFVIFFDRPFEIGDFIVVDTKSGTVEYIGIKTTRIRTLEGEQLICSNTDLTNARLHNYKRLQKRKILFSLGVVYQTSHRQLTMIPEIVKNIICSVDLLEFDRGHFSGYGDSGLNFEFSYFVLDPAYPVYMDKQQEVYLAIFTAFEKEGIEFAYPTQTVFLSASSGSASGSMN